MRFDKYYYYKETFTLLSIPLPEEQINFFFLFEKTNISFN